MLIQQDFHSLAKKQTLAKWNSCVDFFQNRVFQPVVQPKNYLGSPFAVILFSFAGRQPDVQSANTPVSVFTRAQTFKDFLSTLRATLNEL